MQLDGDAAGETPIKIEVMPLALDVVLPRGFASPLFVRP
jgi:diacylglycerol kinase family enzyme